MLFSSAMMGTVGLSSTNAAAEGIPQQVVALRASLEPLIVLVRRTSEDFQPTPAERPHVNILTWGPTEQNQYGWRVYKGFPCPIDFTPIDVAVTAFSLDGSQELPTHPNTVGGIPYNRASNVGAPGFMEERTTDEQRNNWIFAGGYTDAPAKIVAVVTCARASFVQYNYFGGLN